MGEQLCQARRSRHAREIPQRELVGSDDHQANERHPQRVVVKQRYAQQRKRKQNEIEGNACEAHGACLQRGEATNYAGCAISNTWRR